MAIYKKKAGMNQQIVVLIMLILATSLTACSKTLVLPGGGVGGSQFLTQNATHTIIRDSKELCLGDCEYERAGTYHITNTTHTIISSKGKSMCIGNCSGTLYDNPYENSTHTIISTGGKDYYIGNTNSTNHTFEVIIPLGNYCEGAYIEGDGDFVINGLVTCENEVFNVNGSIQLGTEGRLKIINSTIYGLIT